MKPKAAIPRIVKINEVSGMTVSVLFNTGENRTLDFAAIFKSFGVKPSDDEYLLFSPSELVKVVLSPSHTLSWENAGKTITWKGQEVFTPYEIGADTLYELSVPENALNLL